MVKENDKDNRSRNWNIIVYPESAPADWKDLLVQEVSFVCSPIHDKDVLPTGELKKAHYHVLLCFGYKKSYEQVKELTDKLNAPIPQKSKSTVGSVRYMIHIDSPDKYQYKQSDIEVYGNIDIEQYFKMTATDRYSHIAEMLEFIDDNDITEFKDMLDYARLRRFDDWFKLLCDNSAYAIEKYIKSNRHKGDRPQSKKIQ